MSSRRGRWATTPPPKKSSPSTNTPSICIEHEEIEAFGLFFALKKPSKLIKNDDVVQLKWEEDGETVYKQFKILKRGANGLIFHVEPVENGEQREVESGSTEPAEEDDTE